MYLYDVFIYVIYDMYICIPVAARRPKVNVTQILTAAKKPQKFLASGKHGQMGSFRLQN